MSITAGTRKTDSGFEAESRAASILLVQELRLLLALLFRLLIPTCSALQRYQLASCCYGFALAL